MLSAAFPPLGFRLFAWIALVPLFWAVLESPDSKSAANLAGFCGLLFYGVSLHWLIKVFGPMAAAFWCVFALFIAGHAALIKRLSNEPRLAESAGGLAWVAVVAVGWVGLEYFRCEVWPLRNSWLALGYSQVPDKPILQSASLIGLYGLSGLVVLSNASLTLLLRRRWKPAAACAALLFGVFLWGKQRLASDIAQRGEPLPVAIVQDESYDLGKLAQLSLSPEALRAKLLVWPEYAFSIPPGQEEPFLRLLTKKLSGSSAVKVLGAAIFPDDLRKGWEQNFAWVLSNRNELVGRYDKLHPIQYVERRLKPNADPRPVETALGKLGVQICYDLDFEDGARRMVGDGARILVVPDLDPWEWGVGQHRQHSDMSSARAVESGLWIARAASSGYSQIIDPLGRTRSELGFGLSGVLAGEARLTSPGTFYTSGGWLIGPVCLFLTALSLVALWRRALIKRFVLASIGLVILNLVWTSLRETFRKLGDYELSGRTLGELSRLRGFVLSQKVETGAFPRDLSQADPKPLGLRDHEPSARVASVRLSTGAIVNGVLAAPPDDLGTWAYDPSRGFVYISCRHENYTRGNPWWRY